MSNIQRILLNFMPIPMMLLFKGGSSMPLLKDNHYTSKDYWSLPEGERAELIDGKFYAMALPGRIHQEIVSGLHYLLRKYIADHHGSCRV